MSVEPRPDPSASRHQFDDQTVMTAGPAWLTISTQVGLSWGRPPEAQVATEQIPTVTEGRSGKPWVLLVEDEPTLSKLVGTLLDEAGYEHASIADHRHITDAIARWKPQCVILDSDPGSKGHERSWADAAAIRRAYPELPVLMFTADPASMAEARAGTTARSRAAGYSGVLDKPFLVVEFLATLKQAIAAPYSATPSDRNRLAAEAINVFPELAGPASENWAAAGFFNTTVHELRTPLTSIDGQVQLAQRFIATDPERAAAALFRVRVQTQRMNRLISDLLDHGQVSVGAQRDQVQPAFIAHRRDAHGAGSGGADPHGRPRGRDPRPRARPAVRSVLP